MESAPDALVGRSIEWTGVHHSVDGDFTELSTHTVTYETENSCYVTAGGLLVGEASYIYRKMDEQIGIVIYRPNDYRGRSDVVLNAIFNFSEGTDRAVITAGGEPYAVADGTIREVETPARDVADS